jgi:type VI secretion system secreted protein Hcp
MTAHHVVPAVVGLLLGTSTLSAQGITPAAHTTARQHPTIYVDIKGRNNVQFPGDATTGARKNQIVALSLTYETEIPRNPQTGQATGKRMHKPVVFTHDVSPATPYLFEAAARNETLPSVTIEVGKADANGLMTSSYTLKLTNATVTSLRQFTEENILMEEVALTFEKSEITVGTKTVTDDWTITM